MYKIYNVQNIKTTYIKLYQVNKRGEEEDGGRVEMGRLPASPQIHQNSSRYGTTPTKQTLGDSIRSQAPRGGRLTSLKWRRREDGDIKWEDMENFWTGACVPREGESCEGGTVPVHWEAPLQVGPRGSCRISESQAKQGLRGQKAEKAALLSPETTHRL